ncbi:MAG TPA: hypothetical protein VLN49_13780 [Gemmatimonadaceae bacterium]|nr:hypothetical protein [Gemmatimonadaceae bacterium]
MNRGTTVALCGATIAIAACRDASAPTNSPSLSMASAFASAPAGFDQLSTSFDAAPGMGAFEPEFDMHGHGHGGPGGMGHEGPGFGLGLMGGGLRGPFLGDGLRHFPADSSCSFSSGTGLVSCSTTRNGLTVTRISKYTTASGQAQPKIDSLTNTVATTVTVNGTVTRRDSSTSVVSESSSETISGLAKGSTKRTIDGASAGTENTIGKSRQGDFTAKRIAGDTVKGVVIPVPTSTTAFPYPTAGTVIRAMSVTVTLSGGSPETSSRREVITYDGSATARVVITHDGTTQNCTLPLPRGHLSCQ